MVLHRARSLPANLVGSRWPRWPYATWVLWLLLAILPLTRANAAPFAVGGDPRVDPARFRVTTFASGLQFPTSMQPLDDGSLLVAVSQTTSPSFFAAPGNLLRLVDANGDGTADGPGQVLYAGLPGAITSLRRAGGLALATSVQAGQERISILRQGATVDAPWSLAGSLNFAFPAGWEHKSYALAVRGAAEPGTYEVFFNVGSRKNNEHDDTTVAFSGLATGTLLGESIYRLVLADLGSSVSVSGIERVASGLRNAAGLAFAPGSGDLMFEDNGIDTPGNATEPLSVDELNRMPAAAIGGAVEDYGFAANYTAYRTAQVVGGQGLQPFATFQPWGNPLTGSEAEGAVEIAFAPAAFPSSLAGGVFVGFHGQGQLAGLANEENPVVLFDPASGTSFHFISNNEPGIGHPNSLLATDDSLFVADLSGTGLLSGFGAGAIYQIRYVPPVLVGDANGDCTVGAADYAIWAAQFNQSAAALPADFDGSGSVGAGDYTLWAANFGHTCPAGSIAAPQPVPEPATWCLVAASALGLGCMRRRRQRAR